MSGHTPILASGVSTYGDIEDLDLAVLQHGLTLWDLEGEAHRWLMLQIQRGADPFEQAVGPAWGGDARQVIRPTRSRPPISESQNLRTRRPARRIMGLPGSMESRTSPPAARAAEHLPSLVTSSPVPPRTTGTPIRCIIVDDDRRFRRVLNDVLNYEGIVVAGLASTSAEALSLAGRHLPDVVLVDVDLGAESGFDLTQRLMVAAPTWQPTVVLMSAYAEDDIRPMLEASPATAFIPKAAISGSAIREAHRRHRERAAFDGEIEPPCRSARPATPKPKGPSSTRNEAAGDGAMSQIGREERVDGRQQRS